MKSLNKIDKQSVMPIYFQISQQIKEQINNGHFKKGDFIPSERELCAAFNVSRMTVRQAIDILVGEELLERIRGKGTLVTSPKLHQNLTALTSFTMDTYERGMTPSSKVLRLEVVEASPNVANYLNIEPLEKVVNITRIRLADGEPHAYESSYLLYEIGAPLLEKDMDNKSLYDMISEISGVEIKKAKESIEAQKSTSDISKHLEIEPKAVTFYLRRVTYDDKQRPIEYVESHYRIDKFKFVVELDL